MLVAVVCREKKEVSNEIALFYVARGFIDGSASGCSNRANGNYFTGAVYGNRQTGIAAIIESSRFYTYVDRWMWDITLYLLELTVTLRDATNDFSSVVGNSFHTLLNRKSPAGNRRRRKEQRSTGLEQSSKTQSLIANDPG